MEKGFSNKMEVDTILPQQNKLGKTLKNTL